MLDIIATWINIKTGEKYRIMVDAIDTTNIRDGTEVIVYRNMETGKVFVREKEEFYIKFLKE
jgi:hypothetical protein